MTDPAASGEPFDTGRLMRWMATHDDRLRDLVELDPDDEDISSDHSMRAHLQFLAEAMEESAQGSLRDALDGFAEGLQEWFTLNEDVYADHLELARGAIALEQHLQFHTLPGTDPSLDLALDRRTRMNAWVRFFLIGLEGHLGPAADGLSDDTLRWMQEHQRDLTRLAVTFDNRAKSALPQGIDAQTRDHVGRAAMIRAYVRHLATGLEATLDPPPAGPA